jgi:hypothetical protein
LIARKISRLGVARGIERSPVMECTGKPRSCEL